jgi:hypothetical protein
MSLSSYNISKLIHDHGQLINPLPFCTGYVKKIRGALGQAACLNGYADPDRANIPISVNPKGVEQFLDTAFHLSMDTLHLNNVDRYDDTRVWHGIG